MNKIIGKLGDLAGGIALMLAAFAALLVANSPLYPAYHHTFEGVEWGFGLFTKTPLHWINDGLMALFFFTIGLEIKKEIAGGGELSTPGKAALPLLAALGGMIAPALVFWGVNHESHPEVMRGWAIPAATDIAFAIGILSLLGSRVPVSLKILLTAIAVIDDLGAIIIIALFYTQDISTIPLVIAAIALCALMAMNRMGVVRMTPYLVIGLIMWAAVLESGVHATLAGVATALMIPIKEGERLHKVLHPWIAFLVLPLFAFANAGVPLAGLSIDTLKQPVTLGVGAGLFIGKQIGIFLTIAAAVLLRVAPMPRDTTWPQIYGLACLCGIGFTMSLFIGGLAYGPELQTTVRLGVLGGSLLSAVLGYFILRVFSKRRV